MSSPGHHETAGIGLDILLRRRALPRSTWCKAPCALNAPFCGRYAAMIQNARKRISITSPYCVPDETIQMAIVTAGSRGLDVELFVSEIGDQFMVCTPSAPTASSCYGLG